ncbi:PREDICTED: uncharacterized protein LOC108520334 [Rhinopithecus bieti]|uniref:uncharacterized protein LOC108520334 n=1 Tax=Rhinopithecus bieti TaxID=61621 RepID=UPI00083C556D|nr:PREDICTED: uncharacterized protein LOC108520334 [Rhinopithecus bieti]
MGTSPRPWGARHALERDNSRTAALTYMISNPRAGRRLGEKQRLTASWGPRAASSPAICSSPAASLSRASTPAGPTQSGAGAAPASERAGHQGGLAGGGQAAATQGLPGNIAGRGTAAQPRVDAADRSPLSAAPPRLAAIASCCCCRCSSSSSRQRRGVGEIGASAPSADRAQHVPAPGVRRTRGTRSPLRPRSSRGGGRTQRSGPRGAPRNIN